MLRYFAQELPDSHIIGIDISEEQIRQAEACARQEGLSNIKLTTPDNTDIYGRANLCYGRFVLVHLPHPDKLLTTMCRLRTDNAKFVFEEPIPQDDMIYLRRKSADRFREFMLALGIFKETDCIYSSVERLLDPISERLNIKGIKITQPVHETEQEKRMVYLTFLQLSYVIVSNGLATQNEIDDLLADLKDFTLDSSYFCMSPHILHVLAERRIE